MGLELCSKCHRMHYSTDKCAASVPHITAGLRAPDTGVAGSEPVARGPGVVNGAITPKRGRPKTIADMKAYKRIKAKEYRDRKGLGKLTR